MTIAQSINLKNVLKTNLDKNWIKPPMKRDRHELTLPKDQNQIQTQLDQLCNYADENQMRLNNDKTKVMLFNPAKQWDFMPEIVVGGRNLEVVEVYKLVGVQISSNLKWDENTDYITKKAYSRLWMIKRLKNLGLNTASLLEVFKMQIRSVLEFGAVVWHSMLSDKNSREIERVQKSAVKIILGDKYIGYKKSLEKLEIETLKDRRDQLCLNFALKSRKNPKTKHMFPENEKIHAMQLRKPEKFKVDQANTERFKNSSIIFMQNLLNKHVR